MLAIDGGRAEVQGGLGAHAAAARRGWCIDRAAAAAPEPEPPPPTAPRAERPPASLEIDVRGRRAEEARATVRERIDAASIAGLPRCG